MPFGGFLMSLKKAIGCLYGQLIGDSLGCRYEFMRAVDVRHMIEEDRDSSGFLPIRGDGTSKKLPGQVTDDSEMALSLAASLCRCSRFDAADVACAYVRWAQSTPPDIGNATSAALDYEPRLGDSWFNQMSSEEKEAVHQAVLKNVRRCNSESRSNGCLMRISPIAIAASKFDFPSIEKMVRGDCSLTHNNEVCMDATLTFVVAVSSLLNGKSPEISYEDATKVSKTSVVQDLLRCAKEKAIPVKVGDDLVPGDDKHMGYIGIALQSAFFELLHANSFTDGLVAAISRGGDTDTNGAIVGALLGARFGSDNIPKQWITTVRNAAHRCPALQLSCDVETIVPAILQLKPF